MQTCRRLVAGLVFTCSAAVAQDDSGIPQLNVPVKMANESYDSWIQRARKANDDFNEAWRQMASRRLEQQQSGAQQKALAVPFMYAKEADRLKIEKQQIQSQSELLGRLKDNPQQPQFAAKADKWKQEWDGTYGNLPDQAKKWQEKYGAKEGPRIRVTNPYDNKTFAKFYDEKTKSLQITYYNDEKNGLKQSRETWMQSWKRARDMRDEAAKSYESAANRLGPMIARQMKELGELQTAQERLDRMGGASKKRPIADGGQPGSRSNATNGRDVVGTWKRSAKKMGTIDGDANNVWLETVILKPDGTAIRESEVRTTWVNRNDPEKVTDFERSSANWELRDGTVFFTNARLIESSNGRSKAFFTDLKQLKVEDLRNSYKQTQ